MAKSAAQLEADFLAKAQRAAKMPSADNKKAVLKAWNKLPWAMMRKHANLQFEGKPN